MTQTSKPSHEQFVQDVTRRRFIKLGGGVVAFVGLGGLAAACGDEDDGPQAAPPTTAADTTVPATTESDDGAANGGAASPYRVGFAYIGPIADIGWTFTHDEGRQAVEAAYDNVETSFVEIVPLSPEGTVIFEQLAADNDMVIVNSGYGDLLLPVVEANPDTIFMEAAGLTNRPNLQNYIVEAWKVSYILGVAGGSLAPNGRLGYVGAFPSNPAYLDTTCFLMGARTVNPDATLQAVMINSYIDPPAATQAANALIDGGIEVMFDIQDDTSVLQVCQERGIWSCIWNRDNREFGPDVFVNAVDLDWRSYYVRRVGEALAGTWESTGQIEHLPLGDGVDIADSWGANVPQATQDLGNQARQRLLDGFEPYTGPLSDNTGTLRVREGQTLTNPEIYAIDWIIDGIDGLI